MDDSSLTRMAIEEIMREMQEARKRENQPLMERKVNALWKPNTSFLGRTITSVLMHNKRENDRKNANCRHKLKELEDRARRSAYKVGESSESSGSESSSRVVYISSSSSSTHYEERSRRKRKMKREKKRKEKRKHKKHKKHSHSSRRRLKKKKSTR